MHILHYCDIVLIAVFVVVSADVVAFVIGIVFAAVVGVAIWIVGSVFLFLVFSNCHGYCRTSLSIRLICSSRYLVIHPPFVSVNYLHPIAAEVLIVSLKTVNVHCKNYISVNFLTFVFII